MITFDKILNEELANHINNSEFLRILLPESLQLTLRHRKEQKKNKITHQSYYEYGNENEIYLKRITKELCDFQDYFFDLIQLPTYLSVEKEKIEGFYDGKIKQDEYYKYHYDNFIIRIFTSIDICSKIGNIVLNLRIKESLCNWYKVANHKLVKETASSIKLYEFSNFLKHLKDHRNIKIHKGLSLNNQFDDFVFWEEIYKSLNKDIENEHMDLLNKLTKENIELKISEIVSVISVVMIHCFDFLDTLKDKLIKIQVDDCTK